MDLVLRINKFIQTVRGRTGATSTCVNCIVSSSSESHEAASVAFSVWLVASPIFEIIFEETSCEVGLRGRWEGIGKAISHGMNMQGYSRNPNLSKTSTNARTYIPLASYDCDIAWSGLSHPYRSRR
jgi:hypothetical protein